MSKTSRLYSTVHHRLRRQFGPAKKYECDICGAAAVEWSYIGEGECSEDLSLYRPLCVLCHRQQDLPTHCKRGHPFAGANTYVRIVRGSIRERVCRTCARERTARLRKLKRRSPRLGELVSVDWLDAEAESGWNTHEDAEAPHVRSVGIVVARGRDGSIKLAADYDPRRKQKADVNRVIVIPREMVQRVREVRFK